MVREILFDDSYKGPRWRYGLTLRPITQYAGALGLEEWIVFSDRPSDDPRFPHGTIDYAREIPESIAVAVDLVPLGKVN